MPQNVRLAIEQRAEALPFPELKRAAAALSESYREAGTAPERLPAEARVAAYLATRMPATYAAARSVLAEVRLRLGDARIESILDAGAGTGAASLAALELFPNARVTLVERDAGLAAAARAWLPDAELIAADLTRMESFPPHDLVIAAYSLGELERPPVSRLWAAARIALTVIEPGAPRGFANVLRIRDELLAAGARMIAPCPSASPCPLPPSDWCHFGARVERSSIHRRLKGAELGYEDEKFSYVALARESAALAPARIIRRPEQRPGLIVIETCTPAGLQTERVTKRDREAFRTARRAGWGDAWERR